MLFTHEKFLEICWSWRHLKIAHYDYDYSYNLHFLSYVIFDQQLKITFRKSSALPIPEKIHPLFANFPLKIQKVQIHHFLLTLKIFQAPLQKGGGNYWKTLISAEMSLIVYMPYRFYAFPCIFDAVPVGFKVIIVVVSFALLQNCR